jgi:hypothetical protein
MIAKKNIPAPPLDWAGKKAKFKLKYPTLTDADLNFEEDKKMRMLDKLQVKLGKTTKELQAIIGTL